MTNRLRKLLTLVGVATLWLCYRVGHAGDFVLVEQDEQSITFEYKGAVTFGDSEKLRILAAAYTGKEITIIINSPGGAAYEGISLYWTAKATGVRTLAGTWGAYSAAAMFWLGGDNQMMEGSRVGFHLAYCNYWNPPGCDTADIDGEVFKCFIDKMGREAGHILWGRCLAVLDEHWAGGFVLMEAVDGSVVITEVRLSSMLLYVPLPSPIVVPTMLG